MRRLVDSPHSVSPHSVSRYSPRWWLLAGALLLAGWLNYAPYWNPDEGRYAASSLEMIGGVEGSQPDWVVPHLNTIPRLNKPPLVYWLAGTFFKIFGVHDWAGRLGSAIAAVLVLWLVFQLGRAMFDEKTGIIAALVWASSIFPVSLGRTLNTDMLLSATMTIVLYGLWFAVREGASWRPYAIAGIGMGLAMLAKGPVGVALPLLIGLLYLWRTRLWNRLRWPGVLAAFLIAAAISAPWFFAIEQRQPGFTKNFIFTENLARFSGSVEHHKPSPIWYYLPVTLLGLLPWTPLALSALARSHDQDATRRANRLFLWLWAGIIILFFSNSSTKLFSYILPAYPALALLAADGILRAAPLTRRRVTGALVALYIIAAIATIISLTDNNTLPRAVGLPYALCCALILLGGTVFIVRFWKAEQLWKTAVTQFCMAALLYVCVLALAGRAAYYEDSTRMFIALRPQLQADDIVAQVSSFSPTQIFYLQRPVMLPNFNNTSGLNAVALAKSPFFPRNQSHDLTWLFQRRERIFILTRWRRKDYRVPPGAFTWARNNDFKLLSNRPAPRDFRYDFTAPKKARLDTDPSAGLPPQP